MAKLDGKVAIITGAASGVGAATAKLMAERGAAVTVADINAEGAQRVSDEIAAAGGTAQAVAVDVRSEDQIAAMVDATVSAFGRLDVIHNNAAALGDDVLGRDKDVLSMTVELWDTTMAITLRGVMLGCKHALPHMLRQGSGSVINTASVAGQAGDLSRVAYGSAKAGVVVFTQYVATMYGKFGVRANAISPGLILSPPAVRNMSEEALAQSMANRLVPRHGEPVDIAALACFLASDEAGFITGQVINVDGGVLAHTPLYSAHYARYEADYRAPTTG